ncbi:hypothetical protein QF117_11350 [Vibrio sp. YMD68]|uniref:hypothetical protein n=1 Tax=Vibrio sp. YMD68 TaxID=3042300 RepID=UPI00249CA467|nr:hypothetical protein [Vibrio sp. YMD68]WGW01376.1 hypothetical protein QF117_11350 [Vibrio sp. YMD68]
MKIKNTAKILAFTMLISSGFAVQATTIKQSIDITAEILDLNSTFKVLPTAGSWPVNTLRFVWDDNTSQFQSPAGIGFTVESSADVTVALTSSSDLYSGSSLIPVDVSVQNTAGNGIDVTSVTMLPETLYETTQNPTGEKAAFQLNFAADSNNMLDSNGDPITPGSRPEPGTYSGSVNLVFESNI